MAPVKSFELFISWEWEEYLKRQVHALMGQESIAPVYFVEAPDSDEQLNAAWGETVTRKAVALADRPQWEKVRST